MTTENKQQTASEYALGSLEQAIKNVIDSYEGVGTGLPPYFGRVGIQQAWKRIYKLIGKTEFVGISSRSQVK